MTKKLLAFHGDKKIKAKYLRRLRAHIKAGALRHGIGWSCGEGCAIGCTLENYDHARYPIELGAQEELAHLEDAIFEHLDDAESKKWPVQFLSAITEGADLSLVWPRFALWMLSDPASPVAIVALSSPSCAAAVARVAALYRAWVRSGTRPRVELFRAASKKADAVLVADTHDRGGWAAATARAAAVIGEGDMTAPALVACRAAMVAREGTWVAEGEVWRQMRDKLLELLRSAPVCKPAARRRTT